MPASKLLIRSGLLLSILGAAGLVSLPIAAQTYLGMAPAATPAKQTDDDAAEFAKLDKNEWAAFQKNKALVIKK